MLILILRYKPEVGWGTSERQYSVAGFLASFPVFEPHYQVLLSRGRVPKGYLTVNEDDETSKTTTTTYDLTNATMYLEKNWGGSFPSQWFWIQANTFLHHDSYRHHRHHRSSFLDLCVTSTGGLRRLPFFNEQEEEVALIALHWDGKFLPFPEVQWSIRWGKWSVRGTYDDYTVELEGTCTGRGFPVNCPTSDGMEEIALETFKGNLQAKLYERKSGRLVLHAVDNQACLEIGGLPWTERIWNGKSAMKEPIKSIAMNVGKSWNNKSHIMLFFCFSRALFQSYLSFLIYNSTSCCEELEKRASDFLQAASFFIDIPGL